MIINYIHQERYLYLAMILNVFIRQNAIMSGFLVTVTIWVLDSKRNLIWVTVHHEKYQLIIMLLTYHHAIIKEYRK